MRWIRRHWLALFGAIPLLPTLNKWLLWAIGRGGDADFIISRIADPGWVRDMISFLLDPPGWATLPLIVAGLALIYLDLRRRHPDVAPAGITKQQNEDWWDQQTAEFDTRYTLRTQEADTLDFLVDGLKAVDDVTTILSAGSKETAQLGKMLQRFRADPRSS
jgi:hypothetical protein